VQYMRRHRTSLRPNWTLIGEPPTGDSWLHEIKPTAIVWRDGVATLYSRNVLSWTRKLPKLAKLRGQLSVSEAIFDGEVCHVLRTGATSFGAIQNDLSAKQTDGLVYLSSTCSIYTSSRLSEVELFSRRMLLEYVVQSAPDHRLRHSEHQMGQGSEFFAAASAVPLGGIVSRVSNSTYRAFDNRAGRRSRQSDARSSSS
jgi:ATP-dependent DNA ligase